MQVKFYNNQPFKSVRRDRIFVKQLSTENGYSLAENNQKNILKSIRNISELGTKSGAKFLYETAQNLRYGINLPFKFNPKHNWKSILMVAASACAAKAGWNAVTKPDSAHQLRPEESDILKSHDSILARMHKLNPSQKEFETSKNNLEYFIISSETSLNDKKYILQQLDYFLSDEYKINPQLEDKKFQAFSEIINDLSLDKVNSDVPNVKAFNQASTGMCAAFSVARKLLAYEYKRNYTDFILQELDDSDTIMIYDRRELGSGKKIAVPKANIDYDGMLALGMRIVDAATANWMNIADIPNTTPNLSVNYLPYDSLSFNVYNDSHIKTINPQNELANAHNYLAALTTTEQKLRKVKSAIIKQKLAAKQHNMNNLLNAAEYKQDLYNNLALTIKKYVTEDYKEIVHDIINGILNLQKKDSKTINSTTDIAHEYLYIDNEEPSIKQTKTKNYINDRFGYALNKTLDDNDIKDIYSITEDFRTAGLSPKISRFQIAKALVGAASSFRNQVLYGCLLPDRLNSHLITIESFNEDDDFIKNIELLKSKVNNNNQFIIESLSANMEIPPSKEEVLEFLESSEEYIKALPQVYDDLYKCLNAGSRKEALIKELGVAQEILKSNEPDKIKKLMQQTGIYDLKELSANIDEAFNILTYKNIIDTYSELFNCKPDKDEVLANLKVALSELTADNNEEYTEKIANALDVPRDDVIETLINTGSILTGAADEIYYAKASRLINQRSIKNDFFNYYNNLILQLASGVSPTFIKTLLVNNNLPDELTEENIAQLPQNILEAINTMSSTINTIASTLYIEKDGDIINSVYPQHMVLDYYEKARLIPKASVLDRFNRKFEALDKLYAQKHLYTDKEYKQKQKALMKFNKQEKEELNKILSAVNLMYKITRKEKNTTYNIIKPEYEEIFREYGVKTGRYWTSFMPSRGLSTEQEVILAESVTGKPYYIQKDIKSAINSIKNGKFSGITNTSVSDSLIGMHAQYIASIDTVSVPAKNNTYVQKDILFHDNSWGRAEKENIWTDSKGLLRTDYNNDYGYKYGYITNDLYRNGTFTDDLLYKKGVNQVTPYNNKQLKRLNNDETFNFELLNEIILPGRSAKALSIAKSIRDTMLIDDSNNITVLEKFARKNSPESVKHKIHTLKNTKLNFMQPYREYLKRINGGKFNNGIKTEQEYNALPDNDSLKILLEKAALRKMYPYSLYTDKIDNVKSIEELNKLQNLMQQELRNKFKYAFIKDPDIIKFILSERNAYNLKEGVILPILERNNITLNENKELLPEADEVLKNFNKYGYDGSLYSFAKALSDVLTDSIIEQYGEAISVNISRDLRYDINTFITNKLLPDNNTIEKDLPSNIISWIDDYYKPETNEEFLKIFKRIQNYTFNQFDKNIMPFVSDKYLLPEKITGFDIIKEIQAGRESACDALLNEIFYSEYNKSYDISTVEPYVRYERFTNKVTGAIYKEKKFDDIYLSLRNSLKSLKYNKLFNKVKNEAFRKYNLLPAYPYLDSTDSDFSTLEGSLTLVGTACKRLNIYKNRVQVFNLADKIVNFIKEKAGTTLTESEHAELSADIEKFVLLTAQNNEFNDISTELLKQNTSNNVNSYLPIAQKLKKRCNSFLKLHSLEEYQENVKAAEIDLQHSQEIYLRLRILPEYRARISAKMKEWFKALRTDSPLAETKYNELLGLSNKYSILNKPEKLLDEYLEVLSDKTTAGNKYLTAPLKSSIVILLNNSKFIGIEEILMRATELGITGAVADEFDNIDVQLYTNNDSTIVEKMSSPSVLLMMIRPLLMENNFEAAREFVTKLHLESQIIPLLITMPEVTVLNEIITDLEKIRDTVLEEVDICKAIKAKAAQIPINTASSEIKPICRELINEINKHEITKASYYLKTLAESLNNVVNSPDVDSLEEITVPVFIGNIIEEALAVANKDLTEEITDLNNYFYNIQLVKEFLAEINITDNKDLEEKVDKYNTWYEAILTRQNNCVNALNSTDII